MPSVDAVQAVKEFPKRFSRALSSQAQPSGKSSIVSVSWLQCEPQKNFAVFMCDCFNEYSMTCSICIT
ncbi:hypothetical protein YQE_11620, partial [Dendroctonus ponderosae]